VTGTRHNFYEHISAQGSQGIVGTDHLGGPWGVGFPREHVDFHVADRGKIIGPRESRHDRDG
jgi:hypothetical protein